MLRNEHWLMTKLQTIAARQFNQTMHYGML